jgi:hypothetical protein
MLFALVNATDRLELGASFDHHPVAQQEDVGVTDTLDQTRHQSCHVHRNEKAMTSFPKGDLKRELFNVSIGDGLNNSKIHELPEMRRVFGARKHGPG